ncbi:hypothetical protein Pa4123_76840 [Phytohabitans aurantiacus]|uniref:Uncharacterized protein n=1 Tax=Phytohabitans aurantiacus TaxID=3016789 RepID=A0ABQ5RA20_9ACTN|nr:hypothetical protein Pa4123_76840 [Phytohabitans aurantiacus]
MKHDIGSGGATGQRVDVVEVTLHRLGTGPGDRPRRPLAASQRPYAPPFGDQATDQRTADKP